MAEEVRNPTRKDLERSFPDKRTVRAFELLFAQVKDLEARVTDIESRLASAGIP